MTEKNRRVGFWATPQQRNKLIAISMAMGYGVNTSDALRALVDKAPEPTIEEAIIGNGEYAEHHQTQNA